MSNRTFIKQSVIGTVIKIISEIIRLSYAASCFSALLAGERVG